MSRRDYRAALCVALGGAVTLATGAAVEMTAALALRSQARQLRTSNSNPLNVATLYITDGEWIASDLDGSPRDYGMGCSRAAAIEDLETRIDERKE